MKFASISAFRLLAIAVIFVLYRTNLPAATRIKADNADALDQPSSWTTSIVPNGADVAQFDSTITGPLTLALGADTAWSQINFTTPGGDIVIAGGNTLTLSNANPILFGNPTTNLTLNCDVNFAGTTFTTLRSPIGQTLTLNGVLDGRDATVTLGNSAGTILLGNPNTVRIGAVVQVNTAGMRLGLGASSVGDPIVSGPLGTNLFTWAASSPLTELFVYNGDQTLSNPVRFQFSPVNFNSADDLTLSGVIDFNNGNRTLNLASNGVLRFTGVVSNSTGITKIGPGTLELGGTNVAVFGNGLSVLGGTVRLLTNEVFPHASSAGTLRMTNTTEVFDLNGFNETVRGMAGLNGSGNWAGTLDNTAANTTSTLTLGDAFQYTLVGNIQNSGLNAKLALVKVGPGGLILTNARTFSGGITNASDSEIFINSPGAAGTGPITLTSLRSELVYSGGGTGVWTNDIILAAGTTPVFSAADGNVLEIVGVISGSGLLNRTNSFSQQGLLNFSGANTFTGGFSLFGGTVMFSHPRAAGLGTLFIGNPTFTGGTIILLPGIDLSGGTALTNHTLANRDFTIGGTNAIEFAGPFEWGSNSFPRSVNVTNLASVVISGPVTGYGFNKVGPGVLTLNGACSHNGPTTISVGPLALGPAGEFTGATDILVGGGAILDVAAASGFTVKADQSLRVDGGARINGAVTLVGALTNQSSFGSVTFSNNLVLAPGSTTAITIYHFSSGNTNFICQGALTFGGNLLVTSFGSPLEVGDTFKLFDFTGNPGAFDVLTLPTLDAGLIWDTSTLAIDGKIKVVTDGAVPTQISGPQIFDGTNFALTISGGAPNSDFRLLTQTNVAEPMSNWESIATNTLDGSGNLTITNLINPAEPQRYFRAVQP